MRLAFQKYGSGSPLIILHGLYGSSDNWMTIGKILSEYFEVYIPDMRNHGNSPHNKVHTYMSMQEDILEFYADNKIEKAVVCGHSMGGKVAMLFALLHPEKIEKLVIVDIAPKPYKSLLELESNAIQHLNIMQAFNSIDIENIKTRFEIEQAFSEYVHDFRIRNFLLKNVKRLENGKFIWKININALYKFLPDILDLKELNDIEAIEVLFPVLFIRGELSGYLLDDDQEVIKKWFPDAEIKSIAGAGHWVHAEKQEEFLNVINDFLR